MQQFFKLSLLSADSNSICSRFTLNVLHIGCLVTNCSINRNIFCSLVTFIMAIFCAPCLSPSNNCKLLLLKQVWVLPWPTGARARIFSSTFLLTGFLACNRASLSVYVQHCKPDCAAFCLFLFLHSQMHLTSTS